MQVIIENPRSSDRVAYLSEGDAFVIERDEPPYICVGFDESTFHATLFRVTEKGLVLCTYPFSDFKNWDIERLEITSISFKHKR